MLQFDQNTVLREIPFDKLRASSGATDENAGLRDDAKRTRSLSIDPAVLKEGRELRLFASLTVSAVHSLSDFLVPSC